eukprot:CAMPEP_0172316928 /NCGR_PEP_ID=MMETSP1058-20130122/29996_1 /TAXON_ID=83371 /ORGANISM="Detonula confervacea, Strain CCMP 353" /LENGTH=478 /DNA_ID=CAMNT_0013031367 /DNA_START=233 /DNA_END=1669 /DNA_ORIENTATION=+
MAKGGVHGKKTRMMGATKKKKTKDPKKPGKHRKTSKRDQMEEGSKANKKPPSTTSSTRPKLSILGETKKTGPPWQVMGEKDTKRNVEDEKVRRERIRLGIDSPSAGSANKDSKRADVSGANRLVSTADRTMLNWKRFNPISAPSDLTMVGAYLGRKTPPSLGVPEVAFLGRSNVGKSSLLNKLVSKAGGDTARVGKTPGATASVNLYALLGQPKRKGGNSMPGGGEAKPILGFADLPGFGYAKLSKETKADVELAAERYLGKRRELALGVLLVDSRRVPSDDDRAVLAALFDMGAPLIVVATKSDKLKGSEVEAAMSNIREGLGLPDGQPLRVSGVTGENIRELWRIILDACETRVDELKSALEEGRDDGGVMRVIEDEESESDDWYNDDLGDEGEVEDDFDDGEDIVYDQGYDWVKGESLADVGEGAGDFYDGDDYVEDEDVQRNFSNEEKQRLENESFTLKNLEKRVKEMESRGEI